MYPDGTSTILQWFPAGEKAPCLPFPSLITTLDFATDAFTQEGIGEVYGAARPFQLKRAITGLSYSKICGSTKDWLGEGVPRSPEYPIGYDGNGLPTCCDQVPTQLDGLALSFGGVVSTTGPCYGTCFSQAEALFTAGLPLCTVIPSVSFIPSQFWGQKVYLYPDIVQYEFFAFVNLVDGQDVYSLAFITTANIDNSCWSCQLNIIGSVGVSFNFNWVGTIQADISISLACTPTLTITFDTLYASQQSFFGDPPPSVEYPIITIGADCPSPPPPPIPPVPPPPGVCPNSGSVSVMLTCPPFSGTYTALYTGSGNTFQWTGSGPSNTPYLKSLFFACGGPTHGTLLISVNCPGHPTLPATINLTGNASPLLMSGSVLATGFTCASSTASATVI